MGNLFLGGMLAASHARDKMAQNERAKQTSQSVSFLRSDIAELRDQVERLALLNQALWELLSGRLKITEAELERKAQEVDLRDGVQDGKMTAHPLRCPSCGRISNSRHKKCLYCGLQFEGSAFG